MKLPCPVIFVISNCIYRNICSNGNTSFYKRATKMFVIKAIYYERVCAADVFFILLPELSGVTGQIWCANGIVLDPSGMKIYAWMFCMNVSPELRSGDF